MKRKELGFLPVSQTQPYDCDAFSLPRWSQFFCIYSARSVFVLSIHVESIRQGGSCVFYCKWDFPIWFGKIVAFCYSFSSKADFTNKDTFLSAYCQHRSTMELIRTMFSKLSNSSSLDKRGSKSQTLQLLYEGVHP